MLAIVLIVAGVIQIGAGAFLLRGNAEKESNKSLDDTSNVPSNEVVEEQNTKDEFAEKGAQLENYQKYQEENNQDVFVALGIGGNPEEPNNFYLIPLRDLSMYSVTPDFIKPYRLDTKQALFFDSKNVIFK